MKIFGYLQNATGRQKSIIISPEDIRNISGKGSNTADWLDKHPDTKKEINEGLLDLQGHLD